MIAVHVHVWKYQRRKKGYVYRTKGNSLQIRQERDLFYTVAPHEVTQNDTTNFSLSKHSTLLISSLCAIGTYVRKGFKEWTDEKNDHQHKSGREDAGKLETTHT
jgi:hypothetical protein